MPQVELLSDKSTEAHLYQPIEEELCELMKKDKYFNCMAIERKHVQTQGHLTTVRELSDLLPTPEEVEQVFAMHELAMSKMLALCDALKTSAAEFRATSKALEKARGLEKKAHEAELRRLQKREIADKKKRDKAAAAIEKAKEAKLAAEKTKEAASEAPGGLGKKRRVATRLTSELSETDPTILQDRFPDHQISIVEDVDARLQKEMMLNSLLIWFLLIV